MSLIVVRDEETSGIIVECMEEDTALKFLTCERFRLIYAQSVTDIELVKTHLDEWKKGYKRPSDVDKKEVIPAIVVEMQQIANLSPLRCFTVRSEQATVPVELVFVIHRNGEEDVSFLSDPIFDKSTVHIYNKGSHIPYIDHPNVSIHKCGMIGGQCQSYLRHIIRHYHDDEEANKVICFLPASWKTNGQITNRVQQTIDIAKRTGNTSMVVKGEERDRLAQYYQVQFDASITNSYPDNSMRLSDIRPFGKWHEAMFGEGTHLQSDDMHGVFAVHKKHIQQHDASYYQKFLDQVSDHHNPEVDYYLSRSWVSVFSPVPEECVLTMDE